MVAPTPGDEIAVVSKIYEITMASCKDSLGEKARILVTGCCHSFQAAKPPNTDHTQHLQ